MSPIIMNIYPKIAFIIDCPTCGEESTFLSDSLLDLDQMLTWTCGHQHKNDHEFHTLAKFYYEEMAQATKKLAENKKDVEKTMVTKFSGQIMIGGERHG